ncbi:imidazole glycerol phosphate synthase subunit HisF [Humisphaera borealis]|uniref:Imidazole glycerol phosphate synthase subunit HisF n=1 Tax=Humisphaera borealis TaxID=2807512 RepID=A0A7M2WSH8_9BACT|nr:imidazole glycerol phosphate synthase subunit HisF [Humisphaera borealis]QOV88457.1 imidazole glycerol phosphate synthase subunit HisF [Humisphaera borealis]
MLTKRIIPCLDVDKGRVVKGVKFFDHVDAGDPVAQAKRYQDQGADELVFYDISASHEGRQIMADLVSKVVEECFMPLCVGGGVRTLDDATRLIQAGAEKVSINSAAVKTPNLLAEVARKFGRCATVLGLDANRVKDAVTGQERWEVFVNGGRTPTGIDVLEWSKRAEALGAGEIVLNVMNADGTTAGYDLEMTAAVSEAVKIPVVASGGAGSPQHMLTVLTEGKADAALAASIFHFNKYTVGQVKTYLADNGVAVRVV